MFDTSSPRRTIGGLCFHSIRSVIRWLGLLGRCVGASYHASFCCGRAVYSGYVLGTFDCVQLQFTLYYHDVAVVMIVICLCVSCPSLMYTSILWGATPHIIWFRS